MGFGSKPDGERRKAYQNAGRAGPHHGLAYGAQPLEWIFMARSCDFVSAPEQGAPDLVSEHPNGPGSGPDD